MQLLEQLAMGEHINQTLESFTLECASVFGYMECMSELCESEVLLEGIDIKSIFKKIGGAIISLLGKIKDLGLRAIGFLKTKAKWFASKFKRSENDNDSSEKTEKKKEEILKLELKKEENDTQSESPKQDNKSNEKTRDEKIADILNQNPFTGPHPNGIVKGLTNVYSFTRETIGRKIPNNMEFDVRYFKKILNGEKGLTADDKEELDQEFSDTPRRFLYMFDISGDGWSPLKGILNGPNDIPKAIETLYKVGFESVYYYKCIFKNIKEINFVEDRLSVAGNKIAKMTNDTLSYIESNVKYCNKRSQEISEYMETISKSTSVDGEVFASIQKYMSQIMKDFTMLANVNASLFSTIPKILATATDDVGKIQSYLNFITAKINSI